MLVQTWKIFFYQRTKRRYPTLNTLNESDYGTVVKIECR